MTSPSDPTARTHALYSPLERARRDASPWTRVQGILAAVQFGVFLVSTVLVLRYLLNGTGETAATVSVVLKTLALYAIMITGAVWEKDVFGRYLFARPFFWEDVLSMLVMALHTAYIAALLFDVLTIRAQFYLALTAYFVYVVNAGQFLYKFRLGRRQRAPDGPVAVGTAGVTE